MLMNYISYVYFMVPKGPHTASRQVSFLRKVPKPKYRLHLADLHVADLMRTKNSIFGSVPLPVSRHVQTRSVRLKESNVRFKDFNVKELLHVLGWVNDLNYISGQN